MTKYEKSSEAITSNLMLWDPIHTQTSIIQTHIFEYFPQASIDYSDTISFTIKGHPKLMIENIEIISEIKVVNATSQNPAANANVGVVSNLASSLWRSVECVLNGRNIIQSFDNSYNIGAWFDTVLNSNPDRTDYLFQNECFLMDDVNSKAASENTTYFPAAVENVTPPAVNINGQTRAKKISEGKTVTLISDLNCSLFKSGKLLPTNLNIQINLTKNYDGYILLEQATGTHKVEYKKVYLRVTMQQPSDFCVNLMETKLRLQPALYQAEKGMVSFHALPAGNEFLTLNNIFSNQLPVMFIFGIQDRSAYGKSRDKNPFTFKEMKSVQVFVNGESYFTSPLKNNALRFDAFYQTIGFKKSGACLINSKNYGAHPFVAVDLTPDRTTNRHHLNLSKVGEVKLDIELNQPAAEGLILLVYAYFDRVIEIDSERNITEV